ncbi:CHAP domain-containing protein [Bifidobacterium sp. ESL0690]|uniref:CHAP domain-containing protein n=1 Tax=Bifidobacterium sp. ESL0690 TaxID=2983214 RepID=UPI0023F9A650|nr:CHAP domain-containing protein [Bifidobacterium sp. ESL0690]WEV47635.1 CHAP domain-containing protein [Bifidobacterium sp. ESL0690]
MRRAQPTGAVKASRNVRVFHASAQQQQGAAAHLRGQHPTKARKTGMKAQPETVIPEETTAGTESNASGSGPGDTGLADHAGRETEDGSKVRKNAKTGKIRKIGERFSDKPKYTEADGANNRKGRLRITGSLARSVLAAGRTTIGWNEGSRNDGEESLESRSRSEAGHAIATAAGKTIYSNGYAARNIGKSAGKTAGKAAKSVASTSKTVHTAGSTIARSVQTVYRSAARTFESVKTMAATAVAALTTAPVLAGVLTVAMIAALMLSLLMPATATASCGYGSVKVPDQAQPWVDEAATTSGLDKPLIAAIMSQESGFRPDAYADDSNGGTWGLLQMNRSVWRGVHPQGADQTPPEGITDPMTHAHYGGIYLKNRMNGVKDLKASHPDAAFAQLSDEDALIVAHNAGEGNLMKYPNIPQTTQKYLENVHRMTGGGQSCNVDEGATVGRLSPPLVMNSDGYHVNVEATGTDQSSATYERFQCTWWAFIRRRQIGKPVDPYMGNGGFWADKATSLGMSVGGGPRPGDAISFRPGVHGSSPAYGHVAIVEQVNDDGSIIISQSGTGWMTVVIETISAQQLQAMGDGVVFIH